MPERDLRSGRASIAARGASQPADRPAASPHLVWVFYVDIIDFVLLFVVLPRSSTNETSPNATPGNASYVVNGKRFIRTECYRRDEIH